MNRMSFWAVSLLIFIQLTPAFAGKIVTDTVHSNILDADVNCNVYLPDGFGKENINYPVIYLLHGLSDTYTAWEEKGRMKQLADELINSGELVPTVIVMPNAGGPDTANTWNGYFNMPGWSYEDFFFQEFLPALEKRYNMGGSKERRAIMGLSMGGGGSIVYCQHHPDMFSSCYAMSAWLDNKDMAVPAKNNYDKRFMVCQAVCDNSAIDFMEKADKQTIDAMQTVKWFIDCGDDDFLFDLSVRLHQIMRSKKVKSELRIRNGVHNWEYWHDALRLALPFASRNFR